ncbi:hypothetical protein RJT34_00312 [Clitoria ternatea]|uniref:Uncharacterized protein n=1 Tax=Clitoria ternatea TaxID=43366 RepID=A0AAN9KHT8_CLITE
MPNETMDSNKINQQKKKRTREESKKDRKQHNEFAPLFSVFDFESLAVFVQVSVTAKWRISLKNIIIYCRILLPPIEKCADFQVICRVKNVP